MSMYGNTFDTESIEFLLLKESNFINSLPNISPSEIKNLIGYSAYINEVSNDDLNNRFNKFMNNLGISIMGMDKTIEAYAKDISRIIKTKGINSSSKKEINKLAEKFWTDMNTSLAPMEEKIIDRKEFAGLDRNKVRKSVVLLISIFYFSFMINLILGLLGLPGMLLSYSVVAPIMEENCKMIAIKGGFIKEFTIVFNTFEFSEYVVSILAQGGGLGEAIIMRSAAVGLHLTTTIIQYLMSNKEVLDKIETEEKLDDRRKSQMVGHIIGLLIHSAWNTIAVISSIG